MKASPNGASTGAWRFPVLLVWAALVTALGLGVAAVGFGLARDPTDAVFDFNPASILTLLAALGFVAIGAVVTLRQTSNRVGWVFLAAGWEGIRYQAFLEYGAYALAHPGSLLAGGFVAWLQLPTYPLAVALFVLLLVWFPTGRPPSRMWTWPVWLMVVAAVMQAIAAPFAYPDGGWAPLHVPELNVSGLPAWLLVAEHYAMIVAAIGGVASLLARLRQSSRSECQQIKWLAYGAAGAVVPSAVLGLPSIREAFSLQERVTVASVLVTAIPVAAGIAVLKHRLWDVDLLIRRTVVYGVLWSLITAAYVGVAWSLGMVASDSVPLSVAILLTAAVTLVIQPTRRRIERFADRRLFGRRTEPQQLLTDLGTALENAAGLDELAQRLAEVVRDGLGVGWARVQLRLPDDEVDAVRIAGDGDRIAEGLPVLSVPVVHGGEELGLIACGPKMHGELRSEDRRLIKTLARPTGLATRQVQLTRELERRLHELRQRSAELAASRARIVQAQETERRRIQRDLHDGAQQELVALLAKTRLARDLLPSDLHQAEAVLMELQADVGCALAGLREVAQGIHPSILADRGLVQAIEDRTARLPMNVRVDAADALRLARFPDEIEGAAFFVVSEALTNVLKHARAASATVMLNITENRLEAEVCDDGVGFLRDETPARGLSHLTDRVEALGGTLQVVSAPGAGTVVRAFLPIGPPDAP